MALWVPPEVSREYRDSTAKHTAELMEMIEPAGPVQAEWNRVLSKIDPHLMMVRAKDSAHAPGLIPGYWHMLRIAPGVPPTLLPITGPQGEFIEPSSRTLDWLRGADLQDERVIRDRDRAMLELENRTAREKDNDADERLEEATERWAAATRTQVSMNMDRPWSQNHSGERAAVAHAKAVKNGVRSGGDQN